MDLFLQSVNPRLRDIGNAIAEQVLDSPDALVLTGLANLPGGRYSETGPMRTSETFPSTTRHG